MRQIAILFSVIALTLVGAGAFVATDATAIGTWTVPGTAFSPAPTSDPTMSIATAPDGRVWIAHSTGNGVAVTSNATGTWSTPVQFSGNAGTKPPSIGIAANGDVAVAWLDSTTNPRTAQLARYVGGVWQPTITVSGPGGVFEDVRVAVTPSGRIVVMYDELPGQSSVFATIGSMTGTFATPITLASFPPTTEFDLTSDGSGRVTMVWAQNTNLTGTIWTSTIEAGASAATTPVQISTIGAHSRVPMVRTNASGDTYALMATANGSGSFDLRIAQRAAGSGAFGTATVPQSGGSPVITSFYDVLVAPDGSAIVTWTVDNGGSFTLRAARIASDGTIGATIDVATASRIFAPGLGRLTDGTIVLTWRGDNQSYMSQFWSTTLAPGAASFATPTLVVPADQTERNWSRPVIDSADSVWVVQRARNLAGYTTMPNCCGMPPMQIPYYSFEVSALTTGNGVAVVPTTSTTASSTTSTTVDPALRDSTDPPTTAIATDGPSTTATVVDGELVTPAFTG